MRRQWKGVRRRKGGTTKWAEPLHMLSKCKDKRLIRWGLGRHCGTLQWKEDVM